jgi:hypothetical protein
MWQGFIGKEIQRTNRNLLLANLGMVGIPIAIGIFGWSYWGNFFSGPKLVSNQDLIATPSNYIGRYIKVVGSENMETGIQEISQRKSKSTGEVKSETVTARLLLLKLDGATSNSGRGIFVRLKDDVPAANAVTGTIQTMSNLIEQEVASFPNRDLILPVVVDTVNNFYIPGYIGLAVGLTGGIIGAINLTKWKQRQQDVKLHPIAKKLSKYGMTEVVMQEIDRDFNGRNVIVHKQTKISENWLIQQKPFALELKKIVDIIWIYFHVTSHSTNGIPTGKTFKTICCDRHGETVEIPGTEVQVMELIQQIHTRVPWAIIGYTDQIKLGWEKDQLIAFVDQAQQEFKAGKSAPETPESHTNN